MGLADEGFTPLEIYKALEAQHEEIDYCDECEYIIVKKKRLFCGISGKLLHPIMFRRGQGCGPARRCRKRREAINMGLSEADVQRLGPAAQKQIAEQLGEAAKKAPLKYHNHPAERTMSNGRVHRFPSQKEAERFDELQQLQKMGIIRNLKLQPQFTITESFISAEGERVRAHRYTADFSYEEFCGAIIAPEGGGTWLPVVEDVKGGKATRTRDYINNKKALADRGIFVREV